MLSYNLAERGKELRSLMAAFDEGISGNGGLAVLSGAGGTGKTSLIRVFGAVCTARADILFAMCSPAESDHQLGVLAQLLRELLDRVPERRLDSVLSVLSEAEDEAALGAISDAMVRRLGGAVSDVARQHPMAICIDDIQYADTTSLRVIAYLLRRLTILPLFVVVTKASGSAFSQSAVHSELMRYSKALRIKLGPLTPAGVAEVMSDYVGEHLPVCFLDDAYAITGGNPLLVQALAEECRQYVVRQDDVSAAAAGGIGRFVTGDALGQAVLGCLHSGGDYDIAVTVASGMAVLGDRATPDRVARLTGVSVCVVDEVVERLTSAGLVVDDRFRTPVLSESVVKQISVVEKVELHRRVAWLLYDEGRRSLDVARDVVAAGTAVEPWAFQVLRNAAVEALRDNDVDFALDCLRLAGPSCMTEKDRATIGLIRVAVESWRDPASAQRWLDPLVVALEQGYLTGADALELVNHLVWHGRMREADDSLAVLANTIDPMDWSTVPALRTSRAWLGFICPPLAYPELDGEAAGMDTRVPLVLAGNQARAVDILLSVLRDGPRPHTVAMVEEVLAGWAPGTDTVEAVVCSVLALVYSGRPDIATEHCDALLHDPAIANAPSWNAFLMCARAVIAEYQGDPLAAEKYALVAINQISASGWGVAIGELLAILVSASIATGRTDVAAKWLNHPVPEAMFRTRYGLRFLHARGEYRLAVKRPESALEDFIACGDLMMQWGIDTPTYVPWRTSAAQACLALGETARARAFVTEQRELPGAEVPRIRAVTLRVTAATQVLGERPALLQEALTILSGTVENTETIRILAELSQAFRDLGLSGRARSTARKAWKFAQATGLEAFCNERLSPDLTAHLHVVQELEVESDDTVVLTDSEMAVARLAALEHTNREIGRKMNITVSTVEQHLTRVYRKLGVGGRKEIGLVLRMYAADSA